MNEADRAARIEQLLLSGLDHYFVGNYEQAINVWTRVAFLERGHGRARAYIERARSALAERERESEEFLHNGVAAYHAGDLRAARELLTRAVEQGGVHETALLFLQRLGRLDELSAATTFEAGAPRSPVVPAPPAGPPARRTNWVLTVSASAVVASLILFGALGVASWLRERPASLRTGDRAPLETLPIVRGSEATLDRARRLHAAGRSHEALRELSAVEIDDPVRSEADRLRSDIQRELLSEGLAVEIGKGAR